MTPKRDEQAEGKAEGDGDTLTRMGVDGVLWAKEFVKIYKSLGDEVDRDCSIDENWMTTWFCNAIMAGYDEAQKQNRATPPSVASVLRDLESTFMFSSKPYWTYEELREIIQSKLTKG